MRNVLYDQAKFSEALQLHESCLAARLKFLEANTKVADSYHEIALTLEKHGLYPKALSMYENALAIRLEAFDACRCCFFILRHWLDVWKARQLSKGIGIPTEVIDDKIEDSGRGARRWVYLLP